MKKDNSSFLTILVPHQAAETKHGKGSANAQGGFLHSNSEGLCYQADHVFDCLAQGKLESDVMSPDVSMLLAEVIEEVRHKLGLSSLRILPELLIKRL
uniref:Uncharacterized protein n=1 Tax=Ditylenchus dipsaci TaxID=166011 RepID=A0A915EM39_9BILA